MKCNLHATDTCFLDTCTSRYGLPEWTRSFPECIRGFWAQETIVEKTSCWFFLPCQCGEKYLAQRKKRTGDLFSIWHNKHITCFCPLPHWPNLAWRMLLFGSPPSSSLMSAVGIPFARNLATWLPYFFSSTERKCDYLSYHCLSTWWGLRPRWLLAVLEQRLRLCLRLQLSWILFRLAAVVYYIFHSSSSWWFFGFQPLSIPLSPTKVAAWMCPS